MSEVAVHRIVLIRHAKAEPDQEPDHERPLAERGRRDAPVTGRWLAVSGLAPGLAIVSTALRARETWQLVDAQLHEHPRTVFEERAYGAGSDALVALLHETPDDVADLVLVGHNPGLHALAGTLAGESEEGLLPRMDSTGFPTSAVAVLTFTGPWTSVEPGTTRLAHFWTPHA
ncbi:histidine phosphatase family protein [Kitasatospora sp. NBC_01560]|uniref:SixA phosphatase family protein n=1 Tax=Kitasatospora sp. NBC_01560 TaxID=2975965 RepID=UPI00386A1DD3